MPETKKKKTTKTTRATSKVKEEGAAEAKPEAAKPNANDGAPIDESQQLNLKNLKNLRIGDLNKMARELGIEFDVVPFIEEIEAQLSEDNAVDFMASRGEFLNGQLIAALLGAEFVDPADYIKFKTNGTFDPAT